MMRKSDSRFVLAERRRVIEPHVPADRLDAARTAWTEIADVNRLDGLINFRKETQNFTRTETP